MTNFQDPQPQSRRAARQGERSGTAEAEVGVFPSPTGATENDDMWDTTSRRAAQLPPVTPAGPVESFAPASPSSGRRSAAPQQTPAPQTASGEPLDYITQQRPPVPAQEGLRPRTTGAAPVDEDLAPTQALPKVDQPQYRVRDYSPEARRPEAPAEPASRSDWTQPYTPDLDYQTQASAAAQLPVSPVAATPVPAPEPISPPQAVVEPEPVEQAPAERTMTRRELRALQQQTPAAAEEPPALQEPEPAQPAVSQGAVTGILNSLGFVDTDALPMAIPDSKEESALALEEQSVPSDVESAWPLGLASPSVPVPVASEPVLPSEPQFARPEVPQSDASPLPQVAPEPIANTGLNDALAEFDRLAGVTDTVDPQDAAPQVFPEALVPPTPSAIPAPEPYAEEAFPTPVPFIPEPVATEQPSERIVEESPSSEITWTPPPGHWSTQLDEEDEFVETTINRSVGPGATTTSALVLPSIPEANISGPLAGSGEIILTGSIELPQTFSAAAASARLEHSSIDRLFESHDAEVVSTESSPVSAINAVSTQTGSGLGQPPKQQGTKALTALIIAAASMGVVVIGLLVTALALNVF